MLNNLYLKRLKKDLSGWVKRGWVPAQHQANILAEAAGEAEASRAPLITAIMGVFLIGGGVILYLAANWDGMSKLLKLALLLGAMWAAYGVAFLFLRHQQDLEQKMGQALLALGLLLFGANIMLVAQAFHISDRAPDGILMWTLGALAGAWLLRSHLLAFIGILLATLWTGMEVVSLFSGIEPAFAPWPYVVHWPFPIVWAGFAWLAGKNGWRGAARLAAMVMVWWLWITFSDLFGFGLSELIGLSVTHFANRLSFLLMAVLFLAGRRAEIHALTRPSAATLRNTALLAGILFLYLSTLRGDFAIGRTAMLFGPEGGDVMTTPVANLAALVLAAAGLALAWLEHARPAVESQRLPAPVLATLAACMLVSAALVAWNFEPPGLALAAYVAVNGLFLLAMAGTVYGGYLTGNRMAVNLGLLIFTIWITWLYSDTFFGLMDRSLFFVGAGVLLLGGGYALQRQRRRLLARMAGRVQTGDGS